MIVTRSSRKALRTFTREAWPQEYSVLHNNLAIAYLSMPTSDERSRMREALAVQSFEEVLKVINLIDHPSEYAMINNNLGNALQEQGEVDEAVAQYRRALALDPSYAEAHSNRGNALKELKRLDEALASFDRAISLKPDFATAIQQLNGQIGRIDSRHPQAAKVAIKVSERL